ncbi:MAG: hypothetical protein ABMA64_02145 [Myxococcota bacterium]
MIWLVGCGGAEPVPVGSVGAPSGGDSGAAVESGGSTPPDTGSDTGSTVGHPTGDTGGTSVDAGVPGLVGVGYGGIRLVSRDGGATWSDVVSFAPNGLDDEDLLRAVTYGDGLWLATGWRWVTSPDGVEWTDHGLIADAAGWPPCNIVEGLAWADGAFYAACADWYGEGHVYRSVDAHTWTLHGDLGPTGGHLFLSHHQGTFAAYGDSGTSLVSTDAVTWTELPGVVRATWCDGAYVSEVDCAGPAWFDGAYFSTSWPDTVRRSTDGVTWADVYVDPDGNSLYQPRAMAEGLVAR